MFSGKLKYNIKDQQQFYVLNFKSPAGANS